MAREDVTSCPICQGKNFTTIHTCKDHTSSGETFSVKQCNVCSFVLTSPRPPENESARYYKSNQYISHQTTATSTFDRIYLLVRSYTLRWKYNLIRPCATGPLLDVGCGTGSFLKYCAQRGISVTGVEPSEASSSITGIPTYKSLNEVPKGPYSVITLWHVLEHIYPLRETIQQLITNLAEDGTIFIAVPNRMSRDANNYQEYWAAWDVPRHLWHFSDENMQDLIRSSGLQIREIIPMKLDAYYVALLSQKYIDSGKSKPFGILRAIYQGLTSNISARQTKQYSSLIYRITR